MSKNRGIKNIIQTLVFALILGAWAMPSFAQGLDDLERIPLPQSVCGNGVVEGSEDCDNGENNGTEGDLCSEKCEYNIPEGQEDCVEDYVRECYEIKRIDRVLVEVREGVEPVPQQDLPEAEPEGKTLEECIEEAIEMCRDPEEPQDPEPTPSPEEPKEQSSPEIITPLVEGSGCSLTSGVTGSSAVSYVWLAFALLGTIRLFPKRK